MSSHSTVHTNFNRTAADIMTLTDHSHPPPPSTIRYIISFLLVGLCWGFTTPFMRRSAKDYTPPSRPWLASQPSVKRTVYTACFAVNDLLRRPGYAIPLLLNVTGSVWFFLLIGEAELSLTVPIVNSAAFLWTVVGEWWVEGRKIGADTLVGMGLVGGGIALCVLSKS
ncbi:hypothetical protein EJ05DRAFT_499956 [Pseudovirgaria hyperparasitica]|uniref:Integral membrane protein n=1 Tax=Pseudovirgaria hyperparasitica TaxID=470096 RepID=A0A6A6W724_9PEZI|nr:uncharacterized protein EJ05DRAFT_499956 [Pseudovirgaria hyperparasitica]KAF2758433.1 hypothetical protein EJ05DRAFT_499956 [Pseudovirgaria hyperparasitica]